MTKIEDERCEWQHTPGPWRVMHMGGSSTVLCETKPRHNGTGTTEFGYVEGRGHCIARAFTDDGGMLRRDFVCFSHDDARLIAAAPELLKVAQMVVEASDLSGVNGPLGEAARAAIAKALPHTEVI